MSAFALTQEERRLRRVSRDASLISWLETREDALLTMRDLDHGLIVMLVASPGVRLGQAGKLAQQRTGLARVDDLLDPEPFG
jgi:hypothetical protein